MGKITKSLTINMSKKQAFQKFVNELNAWWPREYTWSQEKLKEIKIDGKQDGLCTEIGPHGFRCDWGQVTEFVENEKIGLKWQISPTRVPVPDPQKASDIRVAFKQENESATVLEFEHFNFENHGEGAKDYQRMMDGQQGWDYILTRYQKYCDDSHGKI